jgi:probable HAF family extracellular repeat protein
MNTPTSAFTGTLLPQTSSRGFLSGCLPLALRRFAPASRGLRWFLPTAVAVAVLPASLLAQPFYTLTDLGTLGGETTYGSDINLCGEVTGASEKVPGGPLHAFVYSRGRMVDLGTLGGGESFGRSINDKGEVTGYFTDQDSGLPRTFLYSKGRMRNLGTFGGDYSSGEAINNCGDITGSFKIHNGRRHVFVYSKGKMKDLGGLGPIASLDSSGTGINDVGEITGVFFHGSADDNVRAFHFSGGTVVDLGLLVGGIRTATQINAWGEIVGTAEDYHMFLYSDGTVSQPGAPSPDWKTNGLDINRWSQVAGGAYMPAYGFTRAILFSGVFHDLNDLVVDAHGWVLGYASAINDVGQIVCQGSNATGQSHCLLLTPIDPDGCCGRGHGDDERKR